MVRYLDSVQNEHNMRLASFFFNQEHYVLALAYDRNVIQGSREHEVIQNWIIIRAKIILFKILPLDTPYPEVPFPLILVRLAKW